MGRQRSGRRECRGRGGMERGDSVEFSIREHVEAAALLNRLLSRSRKPSPPAARGSRERRSIVPLRGGSLTLRHVEKFVRRKKERTNDQTTRRSNGRLNDTAIKPRLNRDIRAAEVPAATSCVTTCGAERGSDIEIPSRKANSLVDFRKLQGKARTSCNLLLNRHELAPSNTSRSIFSANSDSSRFASIDPRLEGNERNASR